jgi:uncharacterized membrane protein YfcA
MTLVQAVLLGVAGLGAGILAGLVWGGGVVFTPMLFAVYGMGDVPSGGAHAADSGHGSLLHGPGGGRECAPSPSARGFHLAHGLVRGRSEYSGGGTRLRLRGHAALAHRFNTRWLRWSFALLAVVVAGRLVWGAIG